MDFIDASNNKTTNKGEHIMEEMNITTPETPEFVKPKNPFLLLDFLGVGSDGVASFAEADWYPQSFVDDMRFDIRNLQYDVAAKSQRVKELSDKISAMQNDFSSFLRTIVNDLDEDHDGWDELDVFFRTGALEDPRFEEETIRLRVEVVRYVSVDVKYRKGRRDDVIQVLTDEIERSGDGQIDDFDESDDWFEIIEIDTDDVSVSDVEAR